MTPKTRKELFIFAGQNNLTAADLITFFDSASVPPEIRDSWEKACTELDRIAFWLKHGPAT